MVVDNKTYDVAIIGGGHNGLVCAAYLARAGKTVKVLERRPVVGGAAVTEEFHPGFRNSVAAYTVSLLNPKIIKDLNLHKHGLKIVERKMNNFWPLPDGNCLAFPRGLSAMQAEFSRFSKADANALPDYLEAIEKAATVLRSLILETPPNVGGGWVEYIKAALIGNKFRRLSLEDERLLMDLFTKNAAEFLGQWFEADEILAAFAFDSIVGFYGSPYTPGSAYVLLHHAFGEVNGKKGVWGHAVGGMGAISGAMAKSAEEKGVVIETEAAVSRVLVEKGKTIGVELEDGSVIKSRAVASNAGPKLLFRDLVDDSQLAPDFKKRIKHFATGSGVFRMNVALDALPDFSCLKAKKNKADYLTAGIVIGPSMAYLDNAYSDARRHGWSKEPIIEMLVPSTLDGSLAPKGKHVASLFCQQFSPVLPNARSWPKERTKAANLVINTVTKYAPNFKKSVLGMQVLSPWDLEQKFGLVDGDIFHGRLSLDQMFSARPVLGYADYRMPVKGLYLCGAGAHPGGGVTGAPGHNAAKEILKDL